MNAVNNRIRSSSPIRCPIGTKCAFAVAGFADRPTDGQTVQQPTVRPSHAALRRAAPCAHASKCEQVLEYFTAEGMSAKAFGPRGCGVVRGSAWFCVL